MPVTPIRQRPWRRRLRSLNVKQASWTLLVALSLSALAGIAELVVYGRTLRADVQVQVERSLALVEGTAAEAAFQLNPELAERVVNGLYATGIWHQVELKDDFGRIMAQRMRADPEFRGPLLNRLFSDIKRQQHILTYQISRQGKQEPVGSLGFTLALDVVARDFIANARLVFTVGAIKALAISLLLVWVFSWLITQPILRVYHALQQVNPKQPGKWPKPELPNHRNDELGRLVEGLDDVLQAFQKGLDQRDQLQHISTIDGLTGIANRRQFDTVFANAWTHAQVSAQPLAIIFMDIDQFKPYNDHYGHLEGDDCLRQVATALANAMVRQSDFVARYGGEEFVCVLPNTSLTEALNVAERIQRTIAELKIPHIEGDEQAFVTLSMGVAARVPMPGDSISEALLNEADEQLYRAKSQGRNCICSAATPTQ